MSMQQFSEMTEQQFDQLIDSYIDRAAQDEADVPAEFFFELLAQRLSQTADETVTLLVDVENNDLTLRTEQEFADVVVRGNEIIVGNHRFILQLAPPPEPLPVPA